MSIIKSFKSKFKSKFDLSTIEGRLKFIILLGGIIIVFGSLAVGGIAFTMRSQFCSSCHEMYPEYYTWQQSSHSQIGCTDCHIEPGVINLLKDKMGAMVQVYQHVTHTYTSPIEYPIAEKGPIKNEQCLKCHSVANRQFSIGGDIIVPHQLHVDNGVNCVDCHSGVAHGHVAERGASKASTIPFDQWNATVGKQQVAVQFSSPRMDTCVNCHIKRGVSTNCTTCHSDIGIPASHKDTAAWKTTHGLSAEKNVQTCDKCHSYGFTQPMGDQKLTVDQYVRANQFCWDCHSKRPDNHGTQGDPAWISNHGAAVKSKGVEDCFACHDLKAGQSKPVLNAKPAQDNKDEVNRLIPDGRNAEQKYNKVYCSNCHGATKF